MLPKLLSWTMMIGDCGCLSMMKCDISKLQKDLPPPFIKEICDLCRFDIWRVSFFWTMLSLECSKMKIPSLFQPIKLAWCLAKACTVKPFDSYWKIHICHLPPFFLKKDIIISTIVCSSRFSPWKPYVSNWNLWILHITINAINQDQVTCSSKWHVILLWYLQ